MINWTEQDVVGFHYWLTQHNYGEVIFPVQALFNGFDMKVSLHPALSKSPQELVREYDKEFVNGK